MATLTEELIRRSIPLHRWEEFRDTIWETYPFRGSWKQDDTVAREIASGLSHQNAIALIAADWEKFPSMLRMKVSHLVNDRRQFPPSGNVSKNIERLNARLGGKLLAARDTDVTVRDLRIRGGDLVSSRRRVQAAVVGAEKAFAAYALPPGFNKMPPAQKRQIQQEMARLRRQEKKGT